MAREYTEKDLEAMIRIWMIQRDWLKSFRGCYACSESSAADLRLHGQWHQCTSAGIVESDDRRSSAEGQRSGRKYRMGKPPRSRRI